MLSSYLNNMSMLLDESRYTESEQTNLYFFKSIDYRNIDAFQTSDLTLEEGEKANGYKNLTNNSKTLNADFLKQQINVIDALIKDEYYNNWSRIVGELINNYRGVSSITSQIEDNERDNRSFLIESVQYMGFSLEELQNKRQEYFNLVEEKTRPISLNNLYMHSSGYIYTSIKPIEKVFNQEMLPYVTGNFLDTVRKIDQQAFTQLKVINNDHIFIAFTIDKEKEIMGEAEMFELKEEIMGTTDKGINNAYYQFLIRRIDQLLYYPELRFNYKNKEYTSYLVDEFEDGNQKIVILMLKDYVNDFSNVVIAEGDIYIQDYDAFVIPKSAIYEKDDTTMLQSVSKGYFNDPLPVEIEKYNRRDAILKVSNNPALSSGTRIRIHP